MEGSSGKFWARGSGTIRNWRRISSPSSRGERGGRRNLPTSHLWLRIIALTLAFLLWVGTNPYSRKLVRNVPVRVVNLDAEWVMLGAPEPPTVDVRFSGPARELLGLTANRAVVDVRIDNVDDSVASYAVRAAQVQVMDGGAGTRVESILEDSVRIVFDLVTERMVPLAPRTIGSAPAGFELAGPLRASPALVRVRGPAMHVRALDSIILPPIDVAALSGPGTLSVAIDTTGMGVIAVMPAAVRVFVPLRLQPSTPDSGDVAIIERGGGR